jgi:hypothetical protein
MGFTYRKEAGIYKLVDNMYLKQAGVWVPAISLNHKVAGVYKNVYESEIVVTITANQTSPFLLSSLFDPADWTANKNKRVVINAGVTCSPGSGNTWAIAIQSGAVTTPWGGTLTLDNYGTIQGNGGAANSGVGGDAFYSGTYAYTGGKKLLINNYGTIRSGGGGGGRGGNGGQGQYGYTATEGPYYARSGSEYYWSTPSSSGSGTAQLVWGGGVVTASLIKTATSYTAGIYTYYRDSFHTTDSSTGSSRDYYGIRRTYPATAYTSGGTYGSGGRGQGADGSNASGSAGSAGGTNAGTGGTGGTGGAYGSSGGTGNSGSSGNYTSGSAGVAGGVAGYAYRAAYIQFLTPGTILGRVA